jgi:hypothetical protein
MTEFSFVSVPADTGALVVERSKNVGVNVLLNELRQIHRQIRFMVRGESLAATLNDAVDEVTSDDMPRADIIAQMASQAGIDESTVNDILNANIDCPPIGRLEGFSEVLDIDLETIVSAAETDGCDYDRGACGCFSRAEATASPSPSSSSDAATSPSDAEDVHEETPRPSPRQATEEDYQRLAKHLVPLVRTHVKRKLGKA